MKQLLLLSIILLFEGSLIAQVRSPDKTPVGQIKVKDRSADMLRMETASEIALHMVKVEGGNYTMGCPDPTGTSCYYWEKPAHNVSITTFYMAKYPVTQKEWRILVGNRPWFSKNCDECPVENVSWYDAQIFINTLNQLSGKNYRLPTEAEWEYAAAGGNRNEGYKYAGNDHIDAVAWYSGNSDKQIHVVGQKQPNQLGLFDMSGNVWQWCSDWFSDTYYNYSETDNPEGPKRDAYRVCRGGSWWSEARDCRISNRDRYPADARDDDVGFRIAITE